MKNSFLLAIVALFWMSCNNQTEFVYEDNLLKTDLEYLASDEMEGREAGTKGEAMAAAFIAQRFQDLGLIPMGDEGAYFQEFEFKDKAIVDPENRFIVDGKQMKNGLDYYPISYSGSGDFKGEIIDLNYAISAPDLEHNDFENIVDLEGKVVMFDISSPDGVHPHSKFINFHDINKRLSMLEKIGVQAVVLHNSDQNLENPSKRLSKSVLPYDFPVLFLKVKPSSSLCEGKVVIERQSKVAKNVISFLNKGAEQTIVIGAHYDHLGMGDDGSLYRGEEKMVHNGADDNASGVVCLFELADELKKKSSKNNFLFIAFSGEEKGLLGSNYFVKNLPFEKEKINYMLNMDMVGRLEGDMFSINGIGSSPSLAIIDSLIVGGLKSKTTEGGIGASDHTSFYLEDIPAVHFFSGTHEDYHKPSDDADKINYEGMRLIVEYMLQLIGELDDDGKLVFTKTTEKDNRTTPNFKVTLGVIPDYLYDGKGMRIDGVSPKRPAENAGIEKGDIVIQMGEIEVRDMMSYMEALSKFDEGQKTIVKVLREESELSFEVLWD
ncbi:MAG: M20/M25/M40 family metallo-hydrolase [Bacteroidota bacterium]